MWSAFKAHIQEVAGAIDNAPEENVGYDKRRKNERGELHQHAVNHRLRPVRMQFHRKERKYYKGGKPTAGSSHRTLKIDCCIILEEIACKRAGNYPTQHTCGSREEPEAKHLQGEVHGDTFQFIG